MKVIFLDFDGVINDYFSFNEVNKKNVDVLKRIIDKTEAKVVVTSSHKYAWQRNGNNYKMQNNRYVSKLSQKGVEIFDVTPYANGNREEEILEYLKNHPEITGYVILDDDYIIESVKDHEIFIDLQAGLKEEHIQPAIEILNGNLQFYHDCTEEQIKETSLERLIRMNEISSKITQQKF